MPIPSAFGRDRPKADISATFDIDAIADAKTWLQQHDLQLDGQLNECILRRVLTREGRSRGYINGQSVPQGQLRELGELLIDIHSQHAHQSLLKKDTHLRLLDDFAGLQEQVAECRNHFQQWAAATTDIA